MTKYVPNKICYCGEKLYETLDPCELCGDIFCVKCSGNNFRDYCFTCKKASPTDKDKTIIFMDKHKKHNTDYNVALCIDCDNSESNSEKSNYKSE